MDLCVETMKVRRAKVRDDGMSGKHVEAVTGGVAGVEKQIDNACVAETSSALLR